MVIIDLVIITVLLKPPEPVIPVIQVDFRVAATPDVPARNRTAGYGHHLHVETYMPMSGCDFEGMPLNYAGDFI